MKKAIKIISCFNDNFWYKDMIGQQFDYKFIDKHTDFIVVDMLDGKGSLGNVNPIDCEVIEVDDDFIIREAVIEPTIEDYLVDLDFRLSMKELGM